MKLHTFLLSFLFSLAAVADDDEKIVIAATDIEGLFDANSPGAYDEIYGQLIEGYAGELQLMRGPTMRGRRFFFDAQADCLFVGADTPKFYEIEGVSADKLVLSDAITRIHLRVYTRPDDKMVTDLEQLRGKTLAINTGVITFEEYRKLIAPYGIKGYPGGER